MYLLGATCIVAEPWDGSRMLALLELFLDLYLIATFLLLFPCRVRCLLQVLFSCAAYIVAFVDMVCYVKVHTPLTPMLYTIFLQSNPAEATEALSTYLTPDLLLSPVVLLLFILALHLTYLFSQRYRNLFTFNTSYWGIPIAVVLLFTLVITWEDKHYLYHRLLLQQSELEAQAECDLNPRIKAYVPLYRLAFAITEHRRSVLVIQSLEKQLDNLVIDSCTYDAPTIVLMIGESFNRHHASLYGYDKPTTPNQQKWAEKGLLVPFTDAITSWNVTGESFQHLFSTFSYGHEGAWCDYPFFTQLFKKAGYEVFFLSNQYVLDNSQSFSDFGEDLFLNNERLSCSQFTHRNPSLHTYDSELLADYDSLMTVGRDAPRLVIFHFKAMHFDFAERFPKDRTYFHAADYSRSDLSAPQRQILADYDNAVRYIDDVMAQIIRRFDHQEAIVIHVPDHGELIFDNSLDLYGRTLGWSPEEVAPQFDIPLWVYATEEYRQHHLEQWERLQQVKDLPYMTDALAHTLLRLAGIHTPFYDSTCDILDSTYHTARPRIIRGERDYDTIIKPYHSL